MPHLLDECTVPIAQEIRRTEVDFYERKVGLDLVDDKK